MARVESIFGSSNIYSTPIVTGDHPEEDDTKLLDSKDHRKYQIMIGMLNWLVSIGCFSISFAISSLVRFIAFPRKSQLDRLIHVFGYVKKYPNRRILINFRNPILTVEFQSDYPDATEAFDAYLPKALVPALVPGMDITALVNFDHTHDWTTRRSITGLFIFVGSTPVMAMSKRQGAIETSTYGAEFNAIKTAMKQNITL